MERVSDKPPRWSKATIYPDMWGIAARELMVHRIEEYAHHCV